MTILKLLYKLIFLISGIPRAILYPFVFISSTCVSYVYSKIEIIRKVPISIQKLAERLEIGDDLTQLPFVGKWLLKLLNIDFLDRILFVINKIIMFLSLSVYLLAIFYFIVLIFAILFIRKLFIRFLIFSKKIGLRFFEKMDVRVIFSEDFYTEQIAKVERVTNDKKIDDLTAIIKLLKDEPKLCKYTND